MEQSAVYIPQRVREEFAAAVQRTGKTAALVLAEHRLQLIFSYTPAQLERVTADIYKRTS